MHLSTGRGSGDPVLRLRGAFTGSGQITAPSLAWVSSPRNGVSQVDQEPEVSQALCDPQGIPLLHSRPLPAAAAQLCIGREGGVPGPSRGSASRGTRGPGGVRRVGVAQVPPSAPPIPPEPGRAGAPTAEARAGWRERGVTAAPPHRRPTQWPGPQCCPAAAPRVPATSRRSFSSGPAPAGGPCRGSLPRGAPFPPPPRSPVPTHQRRGLARRRALRGGRWGPGAAPAPPARPRPPRPRPASLETRTAAAYSPAGWGAPSSGRPARKTRLRLPRARARLPAASPSHRDRPAAQTLPALQAGRVSSSASFLLSVKWDDRDHRSQIGELRRLMAEP